MSNNTYLLIEIARNALTYIIWNSNKEYNNSLIEKDSLFLPNYEDDFELFYNTLLKKISLVMKNKQCNSSNTRVYWRNNVNLENEELKKIIKDKLYIAIGINTNFLNVDLEEFYNNNQNNGYNDNIICGVAKREFRKVVICGSFRKHLNSVKEVYQYCVNNGIEVLSPQNVWLKEIYKNNFALFHGEHISNERETYLIENKHTNSIKEADAIIVCNPNGYIGSRTLYEIGYADSLGKRIIFLHNEQSEFDICFPRDYGLLGFTPKGEEQ